MQTFDDFENLEYSDEVVPFQFREDKNEDGTLKWLNNRFDRAYNNSFKRFIMYRRYFNMYKNISDSDSDGTVRVSNRDRGISSRKPKVRDNYIYDLIEQKVSQVSRQKSNVAFIPQSGSEQEDLNNAKACKILMQSRTDAMNFDALMIQMDRITYLTGHSFARIDWRKDIGPLNPKYEKMEKKYGKGKVPKLDEEGKPLEGKFFDEPVRIGDVDLKLVMPLYIFPEEEKDCLSEMDYIEEIEWLPKELVEAKYPKVKKKLSMNSRQRWDLTSNTLSTPSNFVMVRTFWHKPTEYYKEGCKITYCDEMILDWIDFPYSDCNLPYVDQRDIDVPGEFWGRPFLVNIEQMYKMNNLILSSEARNAGVLSAPKYVFPEGSVDLNSLSNEFGAIQFRGPVPPQVLQHNYVNRNEMALRDSLAARMGRLGGIYEVSQGIVPPQISAASAIRYLDEQEYQRASTSISKRKQRHIDVFKMMISRMAQYYKPEDNRMARILGKNNEYLIRSFQKFDFSLIYDVRFENISALSDNRVGRVADIIDLNTANQKDPLFDRKAMIKMLDLGLDDSFRDEATYAMDTARTILDMILEGDEEVPAPQKSDGLIEFYGVFTRFMESISYKFKISPETKQKLDEYVLGLELLMFEVSAVNPKFSSVLSGNEKYPIFFTLPEELPPPQDPLTTAAQTGAMTGVETSKMNTAKDRMDQEMKQQGEI